MKTKIELEMPEVKEISLNPAKTAVWCKLHGPY
jgi:hypothetical protein